MYISFWRLLCIAVTLLSVRAANTWSFTRRQNQQWLSLKAVSGMKIRQYGMNIRVKVQLQSVDCCFSSKSFFAQGKEMKARANRTFRMNVYVASFCEEIVWKNSVTQFGSTLFLKLRFCNNPRSLFVALKLSWHRWRYSEIVSICKKKCLHS